MHKALRRDMTWIDAVYEEKKEEVLIASLHKDTQYNNSRNTLKMRGGGPCGVMVKAMDCGIVVSEFVLQSRYYVHFRTNTLGKGMNPLSSQLWVK